MLSIANLSKKYNDDSMIFNDFTLSIEPGSINFLKGQSGSGKSTLMHILCGIESYQDGEILFSGKKLNLIGGKQIGMVFQNYNLFPHLSSIDNILLPLSKLRNFNKNTRLQIAHGLLDKLSITHLADKFPCSLSGGQQQRVAVARALALEPKIMCMDEPTAALDLGFKKQLFKLIFEFSKQGMTFIISSHDQDTLSWAEKIGRIIEL